MKQQWCLTLHDKGPSAVRGYIGLPDIYNESTDGQVKLYNW